MKRTKTNGQASNSTNNGIIVHNTKGQFRTEVEDRLSCLPDAIILHILNFVESKFAVQTIILSKRWLHLWTYLPSLKFYRISFPNQSSYDHFISKFLTSHNTTFTVNSLIFKDSPLLPSPKPVCPNWNRVIHHVVSRHVQHLDLRLGGSFITLSSLNIPSLKTLYIDDVRFDLFDPLVNILSRCPSLQHLHLRYCKVDPASANESIDFRSFKSTPSLPFHFSTLKTLKLHHIKILRWYKDEKVHSDMFSGFVNLEDLEICSCVISPPKVFIISCPRLINLKLVLGYDCLVKYTT